VPEEKVDAYTAQFNSLPNLQLLQATQNIEKSDKKFSDWLNTAYPDVSGRDSFLMQNHIKTDESLEFDDFLDFVANRKITLKNNLIKILNVSVAVPTADINS
jgi:hypothetical protein